MKNSQKKLLASGELPRVHDRWHVERVFQPVSPLFNEKFVTQQQFAAEADINTIVRNAQKGIPPRWTNPNSPQYGDFSATPDLLEAYDIIERAQEAFMNLPSALRLELGNDPANVNAITREQLARHGLIKTPTTPSQPAPAPAVPGAGQAPSPGSVPPAQTDPKPTA